MPMLSRKPSDAPRGSVRAEGEVVSSRLLPMLLGAFEPGRRINVLDTGGGSQATLDFFAGSNARIHCLDLFSSGLFLKPPDEDDEEIDEMTACRLFREYLEIPADTVFDICLFWDAFHHVNLTVLQGLSRALAPHFDERTLGYGFGSLYGGAKAEERGARALEEEPDRFRYGILDESRLLLRPAPPHGRFYAHTQQQLAEHFPALTIQRATLLRESRLELLLAKV